MSQLSSFVRHFLTVAAVIIGFSACSTSTEPATRSGSGAGTKFDVVLAEEAAVEIAGLGLETPITGRLFIVISTNEEREPRTQTGVSGVPFWGRDVSGLGAGEAVSFSPGDPDVRGFPMEDLAGLGPGEYYVQAFLNVYTEFHRADGHVVYMHLNSGAGQNFWEAPGNVHSAVQKVDLSSGGNASISLTLDSVIQPDEPLKAGDVLQQGNPKDTERVKFVKIQSEKLSEFWGRPMYIGANVLLPAGYTESPRQSYPVVYMQGHFPGGRAPLGFTEDGRERGRSEGFSDYWLSDDAPQMIAISFRDANPYYDTSYSVNSENVGPYGDAITQELIPYLESQFRIIPQSWARVVAGGSTGGWEALAMQVFYPNEFGGAWGWCPDPVDFNYHQIVNIYEDDNAYFTGNEWHQVERPNSRRPDGNVNSTVRQENHMEFAAGPNSRSGGQWAIWEAVFGPVGEDGYPRPIWDPVSGVIDHETAEFWRSNYDINHYLQANWETIGPMIDGKLNIAVGDMDSYYLDDAVYLLDEFLGSATSPRVTYSVQYGRREPHCWTGESPTSPGEDLSNAEFVQIVADHISSRAPAGADLDWMRR